MYWIAFLGSFFFCRVSLWMGLTGMVLTILSYAVTGSTETAPNITVNMAAPERDDSPGVQGHHQF